jgi:chromosome partitioning protein
VSRFLEAAQTAQSHRSDARKDWNSESRPFKVISVTSNKGGVGKTTVACNLAVYLRALREDLPILILTLDDQLVLDRMFSIDARPSKRTLLEAIRSGDLRSSIQLGQFGIHYVSASPDASKLKSTITDLFHLQRVLERTAWHGLILVDTKSDFEILTQNAVMASDLVMIAVKDYTSLLEAQRVFDLLESMNRKPETARIILSLMDLRVRFENGPANVLELLVSEIRRRGYPLFESFISRSAKIEALHTNPEQCVHSIIHGAKNSIAHRQMALLAEEVLGILDDKEEDVGRDRARPEIVPTGVAKDSGQMAS